MRLQPVYNMYSVSVSEMLSSHSSSVFLPLNKALTKERHQRFGVPRESRRECDCQISGRRGKAFT